MLSTPAGLLPAVIPIDPSLGLVNWPAPILPSGPALYLSAPAEPNNLLHEVIFHQDLPAITLPAKMIVERIETTSLTKAETSSEVRFVDIQAKAVDRVDPTTAEVTPDINPADDIALFSYGNTRIAALDKPTRSAFTLSVSRLMDSTLLLLRGERDEATFAHSVQEFVKSIRAAAGYEAKAEWPLPKNQRHYSPPSQQLRAQQHEQMLTKGQRLAAVLKEWLNLDCSPTSDTYQHGQYRYVYNYWRGIATIGLFVELQAPDGRSWIRSKIALSPVDLQDRIREINEEYERRVHLAGLSPSEYRSQTRIEELNREAATIVRKNLFGEPIGNQKAGGANA